MKPSPPSIRNAFHFAWSVYKEQVGLFTACLLTFIATWVNLEIIVIAGQRLGIWLWTAAHLGFFIVFAGMEVGFIQICLALHAGKQLRYADLFHGLRLGLHFLLVQLSYFVIVLVGLALLFVPGAYLSARYTFYAFSFAEGNKNFRKSFQQSTIISRDSTGFLLWLSILILLMNLAGACLLGIGLLITIPISTLMKVDLYRQMEN